MISADKFIAAAEQIAAEEPSYKRGGYGQDGTCDCIGLIIGAIRRCGGEWRGTHGSNYAARFEVTDIGTIVGSSELTPGEVVFKAWAPGQGGYDLPDKYQAGGSSCTGDLNDYYHIGIVESVYPLRIRHMTKPRPKMDTSIGKWTHHGKLKKVSLQTKDAEKEKMMETVIIGGGELSAPIHMRKAASTGSAIVVDIPQGSAALLIEGGGTWNQIEYNRLQGYVMAKFVTRAAGQGAQEEMITVSRKELEQAYDILGNLLGLRG